MSRPNTAGDRANALEWQLWFDGTASPNPGRMGLGVVVHGPTGERLTDALKLAPGGCNNAAELHALMRGLQLAHTAGARRVLAFGDSDFVVRHVRGEQHTQVEPLAGLVAQARTLLTQFDGVRLVWVPRHRNGEADRLAREVLGLAHKPATRPVSRKRR